MKRVLVVDDEAAVLDMFQKFLVRKGYAVNTAENALEALRSVKKEKPDLVLTDYHMPQMNGVELLKELHLTLPGVPVILMSGETDMRTAALALRERAFDFLQKPIDSNELISTIQLAIRRAETAGEVEEAAKDVGRLIGPLYVRNPESSPNVVILSPSKPLDQYSQQSYEAAFRRLREEHLLQKAVVFVLKSVNYMNNIGLDLLVTIHDEWKAEGRKVVFAQVTDPVHRYLKMLGYVGYFHIIGSVDEAVSSVS